MAFAARSRALAPPARAPPSSRAVAVAASAFASRPRPRPSAAARYRITFKDPEDGTTQTVDCDADTLLLDAADAHGLGLPSCCRAGACAVCATRVESGECERAEPSYVDGAAADKGFALLCSTYPRSDMVLLTRQEQRLFEEEAVGAYGGGSSR